MVHPEMRTAKVVDSRKQANGNKTAADNIGESRKTESDLKDVFYGRLNCSGDIPSLKPSTFNQSVACS
jgi:hypothetical protein